MLELHRFLANIWLMIIGLILVLYVVLDGFDLGVGVLSLFACDEERRSVMMASLGSVWDANETWLVLLGGALFGAFPTVYAVVLHGLYVPIMAMLFGLIFRGVAFEFREHANAKLFWNVAFGAGSLLAAVAQGFALGGIVHGVRLTAGRFSGGSWDWLSPFSALVALGVVAGYALLGATYLIMKTEGEIQRRSIRRAQAAAFVMMAAAVGITVWTPVLQSPAARKWFSLPDLYYLAPLPVFAAFACAMLLRALRQRYEKAPFFWSLGIFLASFAGLAVSLYPYIIPPIVTVDQAAAPSQTLVFMLTGVGMLIPVMLVYNGYQYLVFRGKVRTRPYGDKPAGT